MKTMIQTLRFFLSEYRLIRPVMPWRMAVVTAWNVTIGYAQEIFRDFCDRHASRIHARHCFLHEERECQIPGYTAPWLVRRLWWPLAGIFNDLADGRPLRSCLRLRALRGYFPK